MEWVEGFTLNEFLRENAGKTAYLEALFLMWVRLAKRLRQAKIAHGDLQHGNVLLVPGSKPDKLELKLIDYDGMWVPALADSPSGEVGHANYQHPLRAKQAAYGPDADRFPHLVVGCALRALVVAGPDLWTRFDNGDNLLFKETDLKAPEQSPVVRTLWDLGDPVLTPLLGHLILAARRPMSETPCLDELMASASALALTPQQQQAVCSILGIAERVTPAAPPMDTWQPATPADIFAALSLPAETSNEPKRGVPLHWWIAGGAVFVGLALLLLPLLLLLISRLSREPSPTTEPNIQIPDTNTPPVTPPTRPSPPQVEPLAVAPRLADPPKPVAPKFDSLSLVWSAPGQAAPHCLDFTRDGKMLLAATGNSSRLFLYMVGKDSKPQSFDTDEFRIRALSAGAGNLAIILGPDDEGAVWNLALARLAHSVRLPEADLSSVSVSPEGNDALCPGKDGWKVVRLGLDTGMFNNSWKTESPYKVVEVRYAPDGKQATAVDDGYRISIMNLASDDIMTLVDATKSVRSAVLSPDGGTLLAFGKSDEMRVWDVESRTVRHTLSGHAGGVADAVFTSDGRIVSVGADKTLRVWEVATGKVVETIDLPEAASCLRLSPDGRHAATASIGGPKAAIQLWRLSK
jgi:serine/threonine protein kinase